MKPANFSFVLIREYYLIWGRVAYRLIGRMMVRGEEIENNGMTPLSVQPNKRRKKKSMVWEHFTIEYIDEMTRRAVCKQCKQSFAYSTGPKVAGTSHLKRHVQKGACLAVLRNQGNQLVPYLPSSGGNGSTSEPIKRRYRTPSAPFVPFDSDNCRHEMARMIIMNEYPLHMVEHSGFLSFVHNLQPRFGSVSFNTVQGDCVATYLREKQNVMRFIESMPGRVSLSLDTWTSKHSLGYVFITGHFIDAEWKQHRRILNVVLEPYANSDNAISHAVACCLSDWSLEGKLFSVTFNQRVSQQARESLRSLLCIKNPHILNGQLLLGSCVSRLLSGIAKDVFTEERVAIQKIRDCVKYVKTSDPHEEKFNDLKQHLQVPSERALILDDQTQWNTTYQMLLAASESKEVFSCLDTSDPDFKLAPSSSDWKRVESISAYLKPIFDAATVLSSMSSSSTVTAFHEVWKIQTELTRQVTGEETPTSHVAQAMREKMEEYWRTTSLVLGMAVVMDPRFKMKLVEFSFSKIHGEEAAAYVKIVGEGLKELFEEYVTQGTEQAGLYGEEGSGEGAEQAGSMWMENGLSDFDVYIMETASQQTKSEMEQYLEESLLPRMADFDVLGWWKLNKMKYPTLSKMARDILSIAVGTVGGEAMFSSVANQLDDYRSSLRPETVEALVCAKDWLHYSTSPSSALLQIDL